MLVEGRDYELTHGHRLWPFGRRYTLKIPVSVDDVPDRDAIIHAGYWWDGASFLPMRGNSPAARGYLVHDWYFHRKIGSVERADQALVDVLAEDGEPTWFRMFIRLALFLLRPTTLVTWHTTGTGPLQWAVALLNVGAPVAVLWWFL